MASIAWDGKDGDCARIVFREAGRQKSLRLGRCTRRTAQNALIGFERVLESRRTGSTTHPDGVRWLESIDDQVHARVARLGYAEPRRGAEAVTLGALLDRFEATASVKASTRAAYKQTLDSLRAVLGSETAVHSITAQDADRWRKEIAEPRHVRDARGIERTQCLAPATVAKRVHVARSVFRRAVRWALVATSPFEHLRAGKQSNPARSYYITRETIRAVIAECPDAEWRAIVGLARLAGLRCPSEVRALRWGDVNWERSSLVVRSDKTDSVRVVPIDSELLPLLQDLFDEAEPGAEALAPRFRRRNASGNLRTTFEKFIARAGLKPWPRLFHNLRASCATEWVSQYPNHEVARWLGHSPMIAAQHYLQPRDEYFEMATGRKRSPEAAAKPATIPATHTLTSDATRNYAERVSPGECASLVVGGFACDRVESVGMGGEGFEPP
jgi:integrase